MTAYEIHHYHSSELPPEIACQIVSYYRVLMIDDAKGEDRFHDQFADPMHHFVVMERGMLISHADVTQREIAHAGETYQLAGVGEVMTHPSFRREGHGQRAVAAATEHILSTEADIGMLFTAPELEGFYGSSGWSAVGDPGITYGDPNVQHYDDAFVMMLFMSERGKAHRADFERGPIYVGKSLW